MKTTFYEIKCLTNMHVGSGDFNFSVVDNEVEKDPVTGNPIIHASGVKGALRATVTNETLAKEIFGSRGSGDVCSAGTHKFLDALLLSRPMRLSGSSSRAFIPVTTVGTVNALIRLLDAFGCNKHGLKPVGALNFGSNKFLVSVNESVKVEGEATGKLDPVVVEALKPMLGDEFAIAASFEGFDLPVVARNCLDNGISVNLWYEEVVPHDSVFWFAVIAPEEDTLTVPEYVQFGGHSSIGCGFTRVTRL